MRNHTGVFNKDKPFYSNNKSADVIHESLVGVRVSSIEKIWHLNLGNTSDTANNDLDSFTGLLENHLVQSLMAAQEPKNPQKIYRGGDFVGDFNDLNKAKVKKLTDNADAELKNAMGLDILEQLKLKFTNTNFTSDKDITDSKKDFNNFLLAIHNYVAQSSQKTNSSGN